MTTAVAAAQLLMPQIASGIFSCLSSFVTSNQNFTEHVQALDACPHFHTNWPHNRAGYYLNLLPQAFRKSVIFFHSLLFLFHIVVVSMRGAGIFLPYAQEFSASQPVSQPPSKQPGISSGSDTNFVFFFFLFFFLLMGQLLSLWRVQGGKFIPGKNFISSVFTFIEGGGSD